MRVLILLGMLALAAPAAAQTYEYTARTEAAAAARTGDVSAGSLVWRCTGNTCRISGPWPQPGESACASLAAQVGRLTEYGRPGARLDAAALARCNASAPAPVVAQLQAGAAAQFRPVTPPGGVRPVVPLEPVQRPPEVRAVTEVAVTTARISHETIAVEPPPSQRFYAIRDGGGDGDFGGNGPRVDVSATVSADGHCLYVQVDMTAVETRADWTRGRVSERVRIWCEPGGGAVSRIIGETRATASYTDTDWEIDTVVPGHGEVDARRPLPATTGPVRAFMITGDIDGADVGDLNRDGNRTVSGTSVQIQFNPISVVVPIATPAPPPGPPGTEQIWLRGQHSQFHILPHTGGDADFYGNGPRMDVSSRLDLSGDRTRIVATIAGSAVEVGGDTRAQGRFAGETIWTAPPGWRIESVDVHYGWHEGGEWREVYETVLGREARASYTDRDHEQDFLVEGAGEAARHPEFSTEFADSVRAARRAARSHVDAFRVVGDTNGNEAGTRTGVQAFYRPMRVTLSPADPARARVADLRPTVMLDVPTGDYANRLSGGNSCGPQAGSRMLRFYGVNTTYEQFKRRVQSSGNFVSDQSLGTPPGTLRDRMNELAPGFIHEVLPLGGAANNGRALDRLRTLLDGGRPVIVLVNWGHQFARDIISPHDAAAMSHWVVVRGYDARARTFHIIDNGHPVEWSYVLLESLMDYGQDLQFEALFALMNVEKGSILYRR